MAGLEKLLVSTRNEGKLAELRALLGAGGPALVSAAEVALPDVEETGETLRDNAVLKGVAGFVPTGLATLADDTGLCVDALNGAPGVYSARFAGENVTYEDNWRLLLEKLEGVPAARRGAAFVTSLALVLSSEDVPEGVETVPAADLTTELPDGAAVIAVEGRVEGVITTTPAGEGGFGYDPVFLYPPAGLTFAQMSAAAKNAVSHRGAAYRALAAVLGFGPS